MHPAYVAGLMDGEGSIMLLPQGPGRPRSPQLTIGMVDREPIDALKNEVGGFVREQHNLHKWNIKGAAALSVLAEIRPYLTMTRRQALADVLLHEYPQGRGGLHGSRAAEIERLFRKMQALNAIRQPHRKLGRVPASAADAAYLAGILDGEGHITPRLRTEVASTDPEMLAWCASRFAGSIYLSRAEEGPRREVRVWCRAPTGFPRVAEVADHMLLSRKKELVQKIEHFKRASRPPTPLPETALEAYRKLRAEGLNRAVAGRESGLTPYQVQKAEGAINK